MTQIQTPIPTISVSRAMTRSMLRLGVMLTVACAGLLGFAGIVWALWNFDTRIDSYSTWSRTDLLYGFKVDTQRTGDYRSVLEVARTTMPERAEYGVVVKPGWRQLWEPKWARDLELDYLRYFLLPRTETRSDTADWLFCLGCTASDLSPSYLVVSTGRDRFAFARRKG